MANLSTPQPPVNQPEESPLMGLYLDRPAYKIDPKGFSACNNVRIELNRVHADLLGWTGAGIQQLPSPIVYYSVFVNAAGAQQHLIGVTTTDIIFLNPASTPAYMTPVFNTGFVTTTNGSATVTGTFTRWSQDIQYGDQLTVAQNAAQGTDKIYLNNASGNPYLVPTGLVVTDLTTAGVINPGTYILSIGTDHTGYFIILSQALLAQCSAGNVIQCGSGINLRPNVRAGDKISFGGDHINSLTATWYTVQSVQSDTSLTLTTPYLGSNLTNASYTLRQCLTNTLNFSPAYLPTCSSNNFPAAGGFNNTASANNPTQGGDFWFFTNGVDPVVVFCNAYPFSTIYARSVPFVCAALKQTSGLQIYGGLTLADGTLLGTSIASSDNGFPLQLAGGVAFQGIVTDGPFMIQRLAVLGSSLLIYATGGWSGAHDASDDSSGVVTSASFVGEPTIWAFSDVIKTRGPVCGGAVVEFPDRHQFLAIDGEYRYNGLFIQVMNDHIWRVVLKNFDTSRPNACYSLVVPTTGDLIWATPLLTDPQGQLYPTTAYVEHYMEQANSYLFKPFTQRDWPFTTAGAFQNTNPATFASLGAVAGTFNNVTRSFVSFGAGGNQPSYIAGDFSGNFWTLYSANTQNGTAPLATATWASRVVGNGRGRSLVTRVYPEVEYIQETVGPVSVTLTLQDAPAGPVTITDTQAFDPSYAGNRFTTHYRRGRVGAVTISDQAGVGWVCDGYDWDYLSGGLR